MRAPAGSLKQKRKYYLVLGCPKSVFRKSRDILKLNCRHFLETKIFQIYFDNILHLQK